MNNFNKGWLLDSTLNQKGGCKESSKQPPFYYISSAHIIDRYKQVISVCTVPGLSKIPQGLIF